MSYCLNPTCLAPQNEVEASLCSTCGFRIRLKERYRALRPLGQGGFGRTFLAVDEDKPSKPRCVIKQFLPQDQQPGTLHKASDLFQKEAVRLDELGHHPQIPDLLAYIEQEQYAYVVQSFIDGPNLADVLQESGPFTEAEIRNVLLQVLPILEFVHHRQVIHRDIKPTNLIRRREDRQLVLVDFGAARHATGTALERTGTMIGSAEYTAPEQVRGRAVFASDLYSLGVTCIHLLTQIRPFDLFDVGEDRWVWQDFLPDPIAPDLKAILDKLLQRALNYRYQMATEVLQDLTRIPTSSPSIPTASPSIPVPEEDWRILPSPLVSVEPGRGINYRKLMLFLTMRTKGSVWSVAFSGDGQRLAYGVGTRFSFPFRDNSIRIWDLGVNRERWILEGHEDHVLSLAFHPDNRHLVSAGKDETVRVWQLDSEREVQLFMGHIERINQVAISLDGSVVASCSSDRTIRLWSLKGHCDHVFRCVHPVYSLVFSPTDPVLISGSRGTAEVWNWQTRQKLKQLESPLSTSPTRVALSPDGSQLAIADPDHVDVWTEFTSELTDPQRLARVSLGGSLVSALAFSPDGVTLAVGTESGGIHLWTVHQPGRIRSVHQDGVITALAFSGDGHLLASGSTRATLNVWAVAD